MNYNKYPSSAALFCPRICATSFSVEHPQTCLETKPPKRSWPHCGRRKPTERTRWQVGRIHPFGAHPIATGWLPLGPLNQPGKATHKTVDQIHFAPKKPCCKPLASWYLQGESNHSWVSLGAKWILSIHSTTWTKTCGPLVV